MRIRVRDIGESPEELTREEPTSELNSMLTGGALRDFRFVGPAEVRLRHYRAGRDLFIEGEVVSPVAGECARCLESFDFDAKAGFSVVFVPRGAGLDEGGEGVDADVGTYDGDELELAPTLHEHLLVALPTIALCGEECRGLCSRCGINFNAATCECEQDSGDPRLAVLRGLKISS